MNDRQPPEPDARGADPYRPIAVGFFLLALPLWVAVFLADRAAGAWTNAVAAAVMTGLGVLVARRPW